MSIQDFGTIEANASLKQVIDALADLQDNLNFLLNGQLDVKNIRANSIHADRIKAHTVTADRMDVQELSAITANLGHITAGLIEAVEIYGSYIATQTGYPRTEMSVTENLFAIYYSATQYIKMLADASGQPTISFHNGSVDGSLGAFVIGSMLALNTTVGQGNIQISSGQSLTLHAQGLIQIDSWSKMRNQVTLRTLQQDLDALDARISDLESAPPA